MRELDAIAGMYNVVVDDHETAAHQVPISTFIEMLDAHEIPEELCVVGLEPVLADDTETRRELVDTMRTECDYLNSCSPHRKIQFAVEGRFQSVGESFELERDGEFYPLTPVFGSRLKRRGQGWLVSPYRV
ncbi:hypothetical protein [Halarchaeum sp. P4]|uniref:hypothetical protein n=1 Tax=Halarchaeum sp. P4 TaxID=3421639 RepID=UPI003EBB1A8B